MTDLDAGWHHDMNVTGGGGAAAGAMPVPAAGGSTDPRYAHDRFLMRQWMRIGVNKYEVNAGLGDGPKFEAGELVAFVQQKRLAFKEQVTFYGDSGKSQEILGLKAQKAMDWKGRHTVTDAVTGEVVGTLNRKLGASFLSSTWHVMDAEGAHLVTITEANKAFAILRRYGPDALAMFPYDMVFEAGPESAKIGLAPGTVIGHHKRRWGMRDVYDIDMSGDPQRRFDRRLVVAAAIALDTLEAR